MTMLRLDFDVDEIILCLHFFETPSLILFKTIFFTVFSNDLILKQLPGGDIELVHRVPEDQDLGSIPSLCFVVIFPF